MSNSGERATASHVAPNVRALLPLADDVRIGAMQRDRWIDYARASAILERLSRMSEHTQARLERLARISRDTISSLVVEAKRGLTRHALYCRKCVFLNPLDVESPYWKREWLSPEALMCRVHRVRLTAMPASRARYSVNMPKLILQVSKHERKLRDSIR